MCHIGTWSTRYCVRTTEKAWGQEEKKRFTEGLRLALGKGASLPSARTGDTRQRILIFFKKIPLCRVPGRVALGKEF